MAYAPGAVNRFGFNTADFSFDNPDATGVFLSPDGTPNQVFGPSAACSVSLPNPALCLDQVRRIINLSATNAITVVQYNAANPAVHGVTAVVLTAAPFFAAASTLSAASSTVRITALGTSGPTVATAGTVTNVYSDVTYYCDGTTWTAVAGNITGQTLA
jgi:hypothetical protein